MKGDCPPVFSHNCCLGDADAPKAQIRINGRIMGGNSRAKHGGVHGAGALRASSCVGMCVGCENDPRWRGLVERWRSALVYIR